MVWRRRCNTVRREESILMDRADRLTPAKKCVIAWWPTTSLPSYEDFPEFAR